MVADEYVREFGNIERIVEKYFMNGQILSTRFVMRVFDTGYHQWTDEHKIFDFYGDMPPQFVGQNAMYFSSTSKSGYLQLKTANIKVGEITCRGGVDGAYDIVVDEKFDGTVPYFIGSSCK